MTVSAARSLAWCKRLGHVVAASLLAAASVLPAWGQPAGGRLPRDVVPLRYDLRLVVDPAVEAFTGTAEIAVRLSEVTDTVWLNARRLDIQSARAAIAGVADEEATVTTAGDDFVALKFARPLAAGEVKLVLAWRGTMDSKGGVGLFRQQEGERWYAVTQFEPMDARRAFPSFDEPDRKAAWRVALVIPEGLRAFSNMPVESEKAAGPGQREVVFQRTPLLPSYLVAFAVGDFDVRDGGRAGQNNTPISIITPKGRAAEAAYAATHTGSILAAAERYFGQPYPFAKLDLLAYPRSTFGLAMENPGLVTYTARALLARPEEISSSFEQRFIGVTAHEIAHMWFGNYVTPAWWNDLWLNESFASWLGTKLVADVRPDWPTGWSSYQRSRALEIDRLPAARALRQPVTGYDDVRGAFDGITYAKGETLLAMFEQSLGAARFRDGVQRYMARYAWGNASADDFFAVLGTVDESLVPAFRGFAERAGVPVLDVTLECGKSPALVVSQQRFVPAGSPASTQQTWTFPACFDVGDATRSRQVCKVLREPREVVPLGGSCPQWVIANRSGIGYYLPRLSPALYGALPKGDRVLTGTDYEPFLGDLAILARGGGVDYPVALAIAARQAAAADSRVARRAYEIAADVPYGILDQEGEARYAAWVRRDFGDRARALGWLPKPGEPMDVVWLRARAVPFVAVRGQDAALSRKAQQLVQRWLEHRSAIPPASRRMVLVAATRTAGPDAGKLFDALLEVVRTSKDPNEREDVLFALGGFEAPELQKRALGILLGAGEKGRQASVTLREALEGDRTRYGALAWLGSNAEALAATVPVEAQASWMRWADGACTHRERALFVEVFEQRSARTDSGPHRYRQSLEKIDSCLAMRRLQQAPLAAFVTVAR